MLTKEQHINYWIDTAQKDWMAVESMFKAKHYLHCLFWAHLVLEKLAKAHWVKTHQDNIPPKIHNIVWLLEESNVVLEEDVMDFLEGFNKFQLSGRYPDYTNKIYKMCTKEYTFDNLKKVKEIRQCLIKMLQ
jgi:HEPN domain-containing protein